MRRGIWRGVSVHLRNDHVLQDCLIRWIGAFPYAVKNLLRGTDGLGPIADELPSSDIDKVQRSEHPPLAIAKRITALLVDARDKGLISDIILVSLDQNVQLLDDYLGGCERIASTPLPFAYMVHLRRVMILYCFTLPFALVEPFGWLTVPALMGVAYTFFGIEEIGVEIENRSATISMTSPSKSSAARSPRIFWRSAVIAVKPMRMSSRPAKSSRSVSNKRISAQSRRNRRP